MIALMHYFPFILAVFVSEYESVRFRQKVKVCASLWKVAPYGVF